MRALLLTAAGALTLCASQAHAQYPPPCYDVYGRPLACGYGSGYAPSYPYFYTPPPPPTYFVPFGGVLPFFAPRRWGPERWEHEHWGHEHGRRQ